MGVRPDMHVRLRLTVAFFCASFALTACGGGGGSSLLGGAGSSGSGSSGGGAGPASGKRTIAMTLTIPSLGTGATSSGRSIVSTASAVRKPATISSQTTSITVSVNGGTPQIFNAAPPTCTSAAPITCTLNIGAP
ncbi:MAG: hypothetical protein JO199_03230, partial [Candidatus Eremiobacteraeota bacterium]|nr:hypothetical protein [Candidatus Eremiobacteraeota bacterium]